jgi:hypothetical protein
MNRNLITMSSLIVLLIAALVWSYGRLSDAHGLAQRSAEDLARCAQFTKKIQQLQAKPAVARDVELQTGEFASRLETAARGAGITLDQIVRVSPEAARRVTEGPYKEKPTRLEIRSVSLQQLVALLHPLSTGERAQNVRSIRLSQPHEADRPNVWNAEITLSYLIYSPTRDRR